MNDDSKNHEEWLREFDMWIRNYDNIVEVYHRESDRAAAVLASSVLERYLGEHIKLFLIDDPSVEELFKGYAPLSSFSSRISIAFALGLITLTMRDDCTCIRKIRNHFAHHPADTSFNVSPVKDLCANLSTAKPFRNQDDEVGFQQHQPRLQFLLAIGIMIGSMHTIMRKQQRREIPVYGMEAEESTKVS